MIPSDGIVSDGALSAYADLAAALVGLTIPVDCREGVIANLRTLCGQADLVMGFAIGADGLSVPCERT